MSSKYDDPKLEFERGYNFGKEEGVHELLTKIMKNGGRYQKKFETDEILIAIPKEYFQILELKAKATA